MHSSLLANPTRRSLLAGAISLPLLGRLSVASAATRPQLAGVSIQRLAWAGVKIELAGVALFIDAVAPDPANGVIGPMLATKAARSFALVTHHHGDHCDPKALQPVLGEHGYLVAEDGVARQIMDRTVPVQSVRCHEPVFLSRGNGEFVARCVPASDGMGSPQVSWIVDGAGVKIIHCGDTAWHGGWWDIARAYGPFDVAFLPINGFKQTSGRYQEVTEPMSLTAEQAVEAAMILKPKTLVPIHFGSPGPGYEEEADALARFVRAATESRLATRVLAPGESLEL